MIKVIEEDKIAEFVNKEDFYIEVLRSIHQDYKILCLTGKQKSQIEGLIGKIRSSKWKDQ